MSCSPKGKIDRYYAVGQPPYLLNRGRMLGLVDQSGFLSRLRLAQLRTLIDPADAICGDFPPVMYVAVPHARQFV
jgi:hypothetical protein